MIVYAIQNELSRVAQFKKKSNFEKNFYVFVLGEPPKSQGGLQQNIFSQAKKVVFLVQFFESNRMEVPGRNSVKLFFWLRGMPDFP